MGRDGRLAEQVRSGLNKNLAVIEGKKMNFKNTFESDVERYHGKPVTLHIKEFVCVLSIALLLAFAYFYKTRGFQNWQLALPGLIPVLLLLGYKFQNIMKPFWKGWMKFGTFLGSIMSTVILSIAWALMVVPVAIILKIIGKKVMDLSFREPGIETYWKVRKEEANNFELLERQY